MNHEPQNSMYIGVQTHLNKDTVQQEINVHIDDIHKILQPNITNVKLHTRGALKRGTQ